MGTSPDVGRRALRRSWWPWLPLLLIAGLTLTIGALGSTGPATNADRTLEIAKTVRCPQCNGETVAESNADVSQQIRVVIAEKVERGESDDDIRHDLAGSYGDFVLLTPTGSGIVSLVWITPVVALVVALVVLAFAFRRWGERSPVAVTDADRLLVRQALDQRHDEANEPVVAEVSDDSREEDVGGART